jgi:hypothetical protein
MLTNQKKLELQMEIITILFDFTQDCVLSEDIAEDIILSLTEKLK